jgi:hypothetical protein
MIRPANFGFNAETAPSNAFQQKLEYGAEQAQAHALEEFDALVSKLKQHHVDVIVMEDTTEPITPDAVFPNNWISFHPNWTIVTYPMLAINRRLERRLEIPELLVTEHEFRISDHIDLATKESRGIFLEGTGSIIFDDVNKVAYANESPRTHIPTFEALCAELGYDAVSFRATDVEGKDIYHTNVMMSIGTGFSVVCTEAIEDVLERAMVLSRLRAGGLEIIEISHPQMNEFCGNILQVRNQKTEEFIVMSTRAYHAFTEEQRAQLETFSGILHSDLTTIENLGGGSARCMMAGIHLPKRNG